MTPRVLPVQNWDAARISIVFLALWAAAAAFLPSLRVQILWIALPCFAGFCYWAILRPCRWLPVFFLALLLFPPLPVPWGDSGIHIAPWFAGLGVLAGLIWIREWRPLRHPFTRTYAVFIFVLLESVCLAAYYSGWRIALGSLARVGLFGLSGFVFLYTFAGPVRDGWNGFRMVKLLYWVAVAAAAFACLDFYFQFPAPGRFSEQYIYLEQGVLRRAQGLFYEASTLGNFCACFLTLVAVVIFRWKERALFSKMGLALGGIVLFAALMLSYSRASVLSVGVALCVLAYLRVKRFWRSFGILTVGFAGVVAVALAIDSAFPALSANYWGRLFGSFSFFSESPDKILSGRVGHWQMLLDFLAAKPWHILLGIGYKTLPYSDYVGHNAMADNTYLGLLVETGIVGLIAFFAMNVAILRTAWKAMRAHSSTASFLGEWMFCFWCGQMVQMFSGDLITYWRVWPVYLWILGAAARRTGERA